MQTKKEEIRLSLLQAGEDEFFEKGYDKASIRSIVKRAHTTIGNFYNYFESKEAIYTELVSDIYNQIEDLINNHGEFESVDQLKKLEELDQRDINLSTEQIEDLINTFTQLPTKTSKRKKTLWLPKNIKLWKFLLKHIVIKFLPPIDRRFALLMTGSSSTPYAHARTNLQDLLANHFEEHIVEYAPNYKHKEISSMVAHQLIEGLVTIGRSDFEPKKARELTIEQILFIVIGAVGLLQGGK